MATVITSSPEIGSILNEGCCAATPFFTLFYRTAQERDVADCVEPHPSGDSPAPESRVAFLAGKRNGNAVWRNKAKRKLRGAWQLKEGTPVGRDIVLVAKKGITTVSAVEIARALDDVFMREGLLQ